MSSSNPTVGVLLKLTLRKEIVLDPGYPRIEGDRKDDDVKITFPFCEIPTSREWAFVLFRIDSVRVAVIFSPILGDCLLSANICIISAPSSYGYEPF